MSEIANILSKFISPNLKPDKTGKNTIATTTDDLKKSESRLGYFKDEDKLSLSSDAIYSLNDKSNKNPPNDALLIVLAAAAAVVEEEKSKNLLADFPKELKGAYSYFKKYYPQEAEEMMDMYKKGKLNIVSEKQAKDKLLKLYDECHKEEEKKFALGGTIPSSSGKGIITIELEQEDSLGKLSDKKIAAVMRHEYWHAKFIENSGLSFAQLLRNKNLSPLLQGIQEAFCYQKQLEIEKKMGLDTTTIEDKLKNCKSDFDRIEQYLKEYKKWSGKDEKEIPQEFRPIHKRYTHLSPEEKEIIKEQLNFYYLNIQ